MEITVQLPFHPRGFFDGENIVLPHFEIPRVSILIPVYNQLDYTLNCLYSLAQSISEVAYEVILIDDCSTDETQHVVSKLSNLCYVRNETNQGFLRNINAGIRKSRGDFVLFLNNDMLFYPQFLEAMVQSFEYDNSVGAVGGMVLHPDLLIHEAGGYFNRYGKATMWGRGESPNNPEFNFVRVVDYCSGCCLLTRRLMPNGQLTELDTIYETAYYEDSDFCLKLKAHFGLKTVYQPEAKLIHYESVSYAGNRPKLIAVNEEKFLSRWKAEFTVWADQREKYYRKALIVVHNFELAISQALLDSLQVYVRQTRVVLLTKSADSHQILKAQQLGIQVIDERHEQAQKFVQSMFDASQEFHFYYVQKKDFRILSFFYLKFRYYKKKLRRLRSLQNLV